MAFGKCALVAVLAALTERRLPCVCFMRGQVLRNLLDAMEFKNAPVPVQSRVHCSKCSCYVEGTTESLAQHGYLFECPAMGKRTAHCTACGRGARSRVCDVAWGGVAWQAVAL